MLQGLYVLVKELAPAREAKTACNSNIKHHQQALAVVLAAGLTQHDPRVANLEAGLHEWKDISRRMVEEVKDFLVPLIGKYCWPILV